MLPIIDRIFRLKPCNVRLFCDKSRDCSRRMYNHFLKNGQIDILQQFPREFKRVTTKRDPELYVADENAAKQITNAIARHRVKEVPFFEINPGPFVLTKALLHQLKLKKIGLIERNEAFANIQKELAQSPKLSNMLKMIYISWFHYNNTVNFIRDNSGKSEWHENIVAQVFMNLQSTDVYRIIDDVIKQRRLFANGRVEIFATIPSFEYMKLTAEPESKYWLYTQKSCIFQILFECELLAQIQKECFLPWWSSKQAYGGKVDNDIDSLYLVRMVPRRDLFSLCKPEDLPLLRFFVFQCFFRRKAYIIPKLEQWISGIGIDLITTTFDQSTPMPNKTFHMFTQCGELTPFEICRLFQFFQQSPKYKTSCFHEQYQHFNISKTAKTSESPQDAVDDGEKTSEMLDVSTAANT